jgi:hypothetical protein
MAYDDRRQSQTLHRCRWCKEWGRPVDGVCGKCGEAYIPVPNAGLPRAMNPESCAAEMDT